MAGPSSEHSAPDQKSPDEQKETRKRNLIVGVVLVALALFMYLSIIIKTAIMGP